MLYELFSEDTEVFKVKKSSHSKRIAKQLKKEKKERDDKLEKEQKDKAKAERLQGGNKSDVDEVAREKSLKVWMT